MRKTYLVENTEKEKELMKFDVENSSRSDRDKILEEHFPLIMARCADALAEGMENFTYAGINFKSLNTAFGDLYKTRELMRMTFLITIDEIIGSLAYAKLKQLKKPSNNQKVGRINK